MVRKLLIALTLLTLPLAAQARQYSINRGGRDYVAHTRVAPVVVHRALPPFKGQHVYAGRGER